MKNVSRKELYIWPKLLISKNRTMETNKSTCIVDWDLYHEINATKLKFDSEINYQLLKKDINEKSKKDSNKNNKVERDIKPKQ